MVGWGFFIRILPVIVRNDLSLDESIVVELKLGRKKIFFTVLYRSPSCKHISPEFQDFLSNFETLYSIIKTENPFAIFFTGDFNAHSQLWWHKMIEQKHLGLILDPSLSFRKHLNEKIIKAKKNPGIIKHLSIFLPRKTLDQMYKSLVRSHLDYCDILYHIPPVPIQLGLTLSDSMEKAERIQYQAAIAVTGAWQGSSRSKLYEELGWESLSKRRWCRRILQLHKILSNKAPSYLKAKLPRHHRPLYSQNNNNTFHVIRCRSSRYMNSFFPDAIISWNNIITHFDNIPSINILKDHILSMIRPKKKNIFGIHDPLGLRYLLQLRVGLSSLRYHKKCHNFIDTPFDVFVVMVLKILIISYFYVLCLLLKEQP